MTISERIHVEGLEQEIKDLKAELDKRNLLIKYLRSKLYGTPLKPVKLK